MLLTKSAFERGKQFIKTQRRPLDVARLHFHFEGGPASAVFAELKKLQNVDGGFGHALETDLRAPESSAVCTSIAFHILRDVGEKSQNLSGPAIQYLLRTFEGDKFRWRIIPKEVENSPHAPWWSQDGLEESFAGFAFN